MAYISGSWSYRPEWIYGTSSDDIIDGFGGTDWIYAGDGFDIVRGGSGNDRLYGQGDDDIIYSGSGDDNSYGGLGNDLVYGDDGNDRVYGDEGDDAVHGDAGNDLVSGGTGVDSVYGDSGDDWVGGGFDEDGDYLSGGDGSDQFWFQPGALSLTYADTVTDYNRFEDYIDAAISGSDGGYREGRVSYNAGWDAARSKAVSMIDAEHMYAFVTDGVDGYLFADTDGNGLVDSGMEIKGLTSTSHFTYTDII